MAFLYLIAFGAFPSGPSLNPCNSIRTLLGRGVLQLSWVTSCLLSLVLHLPGDFSSVSEGRCFQIHNELDPCGQHAPF